MQRTPDSNRKQLPRPPQEKVSCQVSSILGSLPELENPWGVLNTLSFFSHLFHASRSSLNISSRSSQGCFAPALNPCEHQMAASTGRRMHLRLLSASMPRLKQVHRPESQGNPPLTDPLIGSTGYLPLSGRQIHSGTLQGDVAWHIGPLPPFGFSRLDLKAGHGDPGVPLPRSSNIWIRKQAGGTGRSPPRNFEYVDLKAGQGEPGARLFVFEVS